MFLYALVLALAAHALALPLEALEQRQSCPNIHVFGKLFLQHWFLGAATHISRGTRDDCSCRPRLFKHCGKPHSKRLSWIYGGSYKVCPLAVPHAPHPCPRPSKPFLLLYSYLSISYPACGGQASCGSVSYAQSVLQGVNAAGGPFITIYEPLLTHRSDRRQLVQYAMPSDPIGIGRLLSGKLPYLSRHIADLRIISRSCRVVKYSTMHSVVEATPMRVFQALPSQYRPPPSPK